MRTQCIVANCRNIAPAGEAFCVKCRAVDAWGKVHTSMRKLGMESEAIETVADYFEGTGLSIDRA